MSDKKLAVIFVAITIAFVTVMTIMLVTGNWDSSGSVECVHIGSNPCVPVNK